MRERGEVVSLANPWPRSATRAKWYGSLRALGLETPGVSSLFQPWRVWQIDFNQFEVGRYGMATLFDSGASDIRVSTGMFDSLMQALPRGCKRNGTPGFSAISLVCPCPNGDLSDFPTFTFSFEASGNWRGLNGLDGGADHLVCMPPQAYVVDVQQVQGVCQLGIVDGGRNFGTTFSEVDAMVLGIPFFRAMPVGFDSRAGEVAIAAANGPLGAVCTCKDPKNWFFTGKRLSICRIGVCLGFVSALAAYVFMVYSHDSLADRLRLNLGGLPASFRGRSQRLVALLSKDIGRLWRRPRGGTADDELSAPVVTAPGNGARAFSGRNGPTFEHGSGLLPDLADQTAFVAMSSDAEQP